VLFPSHAHIDRTVSADAARAQAQFMITAANHHG